VHCNYGLYFNIWDRLMRTNHARYEEEYERVCAAPRSAELPSSTGKIDAIVRT
jgi:sterol desaturase/sphingolipid hydroxylase (fatty acid hydroxylase superfamily)